MKKPLTTPLIVLAAVAGVALLAYLFSLVGGEPAPTVAAKDRPDYSKMSKQEVAASYAQSKQAEQDAMKDIGGKTNSAAQAAQSDQRSQQGMGSTNDYYKAMQKSGSGGSR